MNLLSVVTRQEDPGADFPPPPLIFCFSRGFGRAGAPLCLDFAVITCPHSRSSAFSTENTLPLRGGISLWNSCSLFSTGEIFQGFFFFLNSALPPSLHSVAAFFLWPLCSDVFCHRRMWCSVGKFLELKIPFLN